MIDGETTGPSDLESHGVAPDQMRVGANPFLKDDREDQPKAAEVDKTKLEKVAEREWQADVANLERAVGDWRARGIYEKDLRFGEYDIKYRAAKGADNQALGTIADEVILERPVKQFEARDLAKAKGVDITVPTRIDADTVLVRDLRMGKTEEADSVPAYRHHYKTQTLVSGAEVESAFEVSRNGFTEGHFFLGKFPESNFVSGWTANTELYRSQDPNQLGESETKPVVVVRPTHRGEDARNFNRQFLAVISSAIGESQTQEQKTAA